MRNIIWEALYDTRDTENTLTSVLIYHLNEDLKEVYSNKHGRQMVLIEWAACDVPLPDHLKVAATSVKINKEGEQLVGKIHRHVFFWFYPPIYHHICPFLFSGKSYTVWCNEK